VAQTLLSVLRRSRSLDIRRTISRRFAQTKPKGAPPFAMKAAAFEVVAAAIQAGAFALAFAFAFAVAFAFDFDFDLKPSF
jgi:hypothetical protein